MSGTATVLQQFVSGLKSRNEDTRAKSAKDLQHYVTTELREVTNHKYSCTQQKPVMGKSMLLPTRAVQLFTDVGLNLHEFCCGIKCAPTAGDIFP